MVEHCAKACCVPVFGLLHSVDSLDEKLHSQFSSMTFFFLTETRQQLNKRFNQEDHDDAKLWWKKKKEMKMSSRHKIKPETISSVERTDDLDSGGWRMIRSRPVWDQIKWGHRTFEHTLNFIRKKIKHFVRTGAQIYRLKWFWYFFGYG